MNYALHSDLNFE